MTYALFLPEHHHYCCHHHHNHLSLSFSINKLEESKSYSLISECMSFKQNKIKGLFPFILNVKYSIYTKGFISTNPTKHLDSVPRVPTFNIRVQTFRNQIISHFNDLLLYVLFDLVGAEHHRRQGSLSTIQEYSGT